MTKNKFSKKELKRESRRRQTIDSQLMTSKLPKGRININDLLKEEADEVREEGFELKQFKLLFANGKRKLVKEIKG